MSISKKQNIVPGLIFKLHDLAQAVILLNRHVLHLYQNYLTQRYTWFLAMKTDHSLQYKPLSKFDSERVLSNKSG